MGMKKPLSLNKFSKKTNRKAKKASTVQEKIIEAVLPNMKKKNPQDLTLRNLHAMKKTLVTLEDRLAALSERVKKLEDRPALHDQIIAHSLPQDIEAIKKAIYPDPTGD